MQSFGWIRNKKAGYFANAVGALQATMFEYMEGATNKKEVEEFIKIVKWEAVMVIDVHYHPTFFEEVCKTEQIAQKKKRGYGFTIKHLCCLSKEFLNV